MNVLILGKDGMLGHKLYQVLSTDSEFNTFGTSRKSHSTNTIYFDPLVNFDTILKIIKVYKIDVIVNCIGILNHHRDQNQLFSINSIFPKKLELLLIQSTVRIIHLSTDCVFNGKKGMYSEKSIPDADDLYGKSKFLGELNNKKDLTIRCSIIGPELESDHNSGLLDWFFKQYKNDSISGYTNVYWTGTSTLKLSRILIHAISHNLTGLHHVSVPKKISKFELLKLFYKYLKTERKIKIIPASKPSYDKSLDSIANSLIISKDYDTIVKEMFEDIYKRNELYKHYIFLN